MTDISHDARKMMRIALGLSWCNPLAARNRYFLTKKSRAWIIWADLVKKGYATFEPGREGAFDFFSVTGRGYDAVRQPGEAATVDVEAALRLLNKHPSVGTDITLTEASA